MIKKLTIMLTFHKYNTIQVRHS